METETNTKLGMYKYKSIVDLVLDDGNGVAHVVDFKTGNLKYVDNGQLSSYALPFLADRSTWQKDTVKLTYAFLREASVKSFYVTRRDCSPVVRRILSAVENIEGDARFEARPSRLCDWCGVRHYCPAYDS